MAIASNDAERSAPTEPIPRLFGTDGIRMEVGSEFTPTFVAEIGAALATYLNGSGEVLLARDFRLSSEAMAAVLRGSLLLGGINVRDLGVMPTPCLQFNVRALSATLGVTVTASHNPPEFNGVKITGPLGTEIPREAEVAIETAIHRKAFLLGSWERIGTLREDPEGVDRYLGSILHHVDPGPIRSARPTVVLDPGNGTSAVTSPTLLRELGCRLLTLNANPDGHFPGRPSEPSEENLASLRTAVPELGASVGFAHDGDSDRLSVVDELGQFIRGDVLLALLARYRLREFPGGVVVTSVSSSNLVADIVRQEGGRLEVTRSGSLPVARGMLEHHATFGGEENGGYYWPEHQVARDGPMTSAKVVQLLAMTGRPLSELVAELPRYHLQKTKVPLAKTLREPVMEEVRRELCADASRFLLVDGVKVFYDDGWLLVRPSGTEPICRIFSEGRTPDRARQLRDHGAGLVRRITESLSGSAS
jgi:phosphomannomutase/phosphoglucomutase